MKLDIGCGNHKDGPDWTGIDRQPLGGVDIVHDLNVHPWPVESGSVEQAKAWHVIEHIPPVSVEAQGTRFPFLEFMDECWRVLQPGARLDIECPHGASDGFRHDPTHCNPVDEQTFEYFDPRCEFYAIYRPKPWKIITLNWTRDGNVRAVLEKLADA